MKSAIPWILGVTIMLSFITNATAAEQMLFDFEDGAANWGAQVNWKDVSGVGVEQNADWAASGSHSIKGVVDLTTAKEAYSIQIFQDIDVSAFSAIKLTVKQDGAGADVRAKLFIKYSDSWTWKDGGEVKIFVDAVTGRQAEISV